MKAAVIHAPHDLRVDEVDTPACGATDVVVRVRAGGICGSDLHYYHHGGFGTVRIKHPMVLGHEVAGEVVSVGAEVTHVRPGDTVAINPSLPCGGCRFCLTGQPSHCTNMRFYGSAMRVPHVHGGFRETLVCEGRRAVKAAIPASRAAFAEPLSVCLHAVRQAGPMLGQRVLVTGAGPIGTLAVMAARRAGAGEIVAVDLLAAPLEIARRVGADRTHDLRADPEALRAYAPDKGYFDVALEASGSAAALASAIEVVRPGGTIVQIGINAGDVTFPLNTLVAKELTLRGTFRFHEEFDWAVRLLESGFDVAPLLTEMVPLADAVRAFDLASDRSRAMKVMLAF
jgi:L-idonate 5-dehydrogenase